MRDIKITTEYTEAVEQTNYPVFVYGTLRFDGGNHARHLANRYENMEPVLVPGVKMLTFSRGNVPFAAIGDQDDRIVTEKYTIPDENWESAIRMLDSLEGFRGSGADNMYDRALIEFTDRFGEEQVGWLYVLPPKQYRAYPEERIVVDWTADKVSEAGINIKDDSWTRRRFNLPVE